jgi:hypothetical protein
LKVLLRAGSDPLLVNKKGENALTFLRQPDQLGDAWEFGMIDILIDAVDAMKIRRHKEGIGEWNEDDGMSSLNSAARSQVSGSLDGSQSQLSPIHSKNSAEKKKSKLAIENGDGMRSKSAKNLRY